MNAHRCIGALFLLALVTVCQAAGGEGESLKIQDVALTDGAKFSGCVVNAQGKRSSDVEVKLHQDGSERCRRTTDDHGEFEVSDLQGGLYAITAGDSTTIVRVWAEGTAPPNAVESLLLSESNVLRGQTGEGSSFVNPGNGKVSSQKVGILNHQVLVGVKPSAS